MNSRATAALALKQVLVDGKNLDHALHNITDDKAFIQVLCYGVCRYYHQLKFIESELLDKPLKEKDFLVSALILLGLYQVIYLNTEDYAAVNESVTACEDINKPWAKQLINAVLRKFIRERETLLAKCHSNDASHTSHPNWLIKQIKQAYPDQWQHILSANNQQAPLTLRVNQQQMTREKYMANLLQRNTACEHTAYAPHGITLTTPEDVTQLPGFADGTVSVQDEAAQLATPLLDLQPGQHVLDACAAPGGKTCHMLETEPSIHLTAIDNSEKRSQRISENLQRLQLNAKLIIADASEPDTWWDQAKFDRILCDAPCSATGVIRRHPDIKLLRRAADITALQHTQLKLLNALWPLLKPDGLLLYTTCSILPAENDDVITAFCQQQPDAKLIPIHTDWGIATHYGRQLLPSTTDGFFYAKISKTI